MDNPCGCCNLNEPEVKKRRILGYASLVIAFALVALNKLHPPPSWMLWSPAIPFFFGYRCLSLLFFAHTEDGERAHNFTKFCGIA